MHNSFDAGLDGMIVSSVDCVILETVFFVCNELTDATQGSELDG